MPTGRVITHRKITQMEQNTFTRNEWNEIFRNLGRLVGEYANSVLTRIDDRTTELQESKLTDLDNKVWAIQVKVDKMSQRNETVVPQSEIAFEILASFLDTVSVLREIDHEIAQTDNSDIDVRLDEMANSCVRLVQMLSSATITSL